MRIACVTMQRNEAQCLEPWVRYHGYLFGFENLFILDHGSECLRVKILLQEYSARGAHVTYLGSAADYRQKGLFVSNEIKAAEARGNYDFLFPIDCDELLCVRDSAGEPTVSRTRIHEALVPYLNESCTLQISENFMNQPQFPGFFVPAKYQKVFFARGCCEMLDHGNHTAISKKSQDCKITPFAYMHFHFKKFEITRDGAREKLLPWVNPDDPEAIHAFDGPGVHLKRYFLQSEEQYYSCFTNAPPAFYFKEFVDICHALEIDENFVMMKPAER